MAVHRVGIYDVGMHDMVVPNVDVHSLGMQCTCMDGVDMCAVGVHEKFSSAGNFFLCAH